MDDLLKIFLVTTNPVLEEIVVKLHHRMINETRNAFIAGLKIRVFQLNLIVPRHPIRHVLSARSQYNLIFPFTAKPLFLTCYMCTSYSQSTT